MIEMDNNNKILSKIIHLEDKKQSLVNYIKKILEMAEKGEIKKIMFASFIKKDLLEAEIKNDCLVHEIITGYYNLSQLERQYLIAGLQTDLNFSIVKSNVDDLIEIIEY